jgi:hypothetical protein
MSWGGFMNEPDDLPKPKPQTPTDTQENTND